MSLQLWYVEKILVNKNHFGNNEISHASMEWADKKSYKYFKQYSP